MATRWGIASAGRISHDFATAVNLLPRSDHQIVAVAAQDLQRAKNFATLHKIEKAYKSYDELAKDKDVEIVYIGSLITTHYPIAKLMLENGKHVLCEKPLCLNQKQVKSLVDLAAQKKLFFMEAVWSRCFPTYIKLREYIDSGALGDIVHVRVEFGVPIVDVERIKSNKLGGGTILDLGIYTLQFTQLAFKGQDPVKIVANGHVNKDGVDTSMSCVLTFANGGTAVLTTQSRLTLSNRALIVGTKSSAELHAPFWCPTEVMLGSTLHSFSLPEHPDTFEFDNSVGLAFEAEECRKCIKNGLLESPKMTHKESLQLAKLEDELRRQLGVKFDEDNQAF